MQQDFVSSVEKLNRQFIDSARRLSEINLRTIERLSERNLETVATYMDVGVKELELLAGSKDAASIMNEQVKVMTETNEKLVEQARKTAEVLTDARAELTEWAQDGFKAAQASVEEAAPASVKKAA